MNQEDKYQLYDYLKKVKDKGINRAYAHWTAGRYDQVFNDYHACIKGNGEVYFMTDNLAEIKNHTYGRNSKAIGIALCCAYNAKFPHNFGEYPPTQAQIETMSEVWAIISKELNIPIAKDHFMTHCEAAILDDYGPGSGDPQTRWDLYQLQDYDGVWKDGGDILRGKAVWYREKLI